MTPRHTSAKPIPEGTAIALYPLPKPRVKLIACLLQGFRQYAREPQQLQSIVDEVNEILKGERLESPYQELLEGLQEALKANRPLDHPLLQDLASRAGMELRQLLELAEEQAAPSNAPYYAQKLLEARRYRKIRALGTQLYNQPESAAEILPELARLQQRIQEQELYGYTSLNRVYNRINAPLDLAEATPQPVEWLVKDLIPARHATNLYGDSGTGKSLLALYLALCVIEGIPFLNFPTTKRGKVLYLDLELDAEIHTLRWWAIARGAGYETPPKGLRYVRWTEGLIGHEQELWELIEQEQPALLIVDSFGKAVGKPLDPDLAIALYNLFDALPVPVLVIDHTAKPNPEIPAESAREYGTVYKRHYARSAIQVDLQGSEYGQIGLILRHQKSNFGRLAPEIPLSLAFVEEDGVMLEVRLQYGGQAVQANAELFGRRGEVVRYLSENGEATQKQIAEGIDLSQGRVSIYLKQLMAEGLIEEVPDTYPKRYRLQAIPEGGSSYSVIRPINTPNNRISAVSDTEQPTEPRAGSYSVIRGEANNRISVDAESEPNPDPHGGSYSLIRPLNSANNRITADANLPPDLFQNRTPLESCIPADLLQAWLPQGIADADLDAVQVMLAYAEARGFPALVVDGYTIHGDLAGWLTAAGQLAGTPAIARATRMLHTLDAGGVPHAPTHNTLLRNGDASMTPSQLQLLEG
jgi:DNA-binding transcriptional ArsR family regulator